jgi:hypothetical protein
VGHDTIIRCNRVDIGAIYTAANIPAWGVVVWYLTRYSR